MAEAADQDLIGTVASAAASDEVAFGRIVVDYHEDMRRVCVFIIDGDFPPPPENASTR